MISADLILKGLGGVAIVGGAAGVGVCYHQEKWIFAKEKKEELSTFAAKAGLNCNGTPTAETGINCTKLSTFTKNIKAKQGNTDIEVSSLPDNSGKIKVYKTSKGETYNNDFKFVIEENDISGTSSNKLEQFETYEIKQDGADWKLIRKSEAKDGIKKALGLDSCTFPSGDSGCALDEAKFKKINFEGGSEGRTAPPANSKLKISKVEGDGSSDYGPFGYKFVLESANDVTIKTAVTIKGGTNTEFKIKRTTGNNNITLEKAWTVTTLGAKVGLTCTATGGSGTTKECSLENSKKINVKDGENKRKDATFQNGDASKKLTFEEGVTGHNQGFKFFTSEEGGITLQNGTPEGNSPATIEKFDASNGSVTYQILKDGDDWYLTKATGGGAAG